MEDTRHLETCKRCGWRWFTLVLKKHTGSTDPKLMIGEMAAPKRPRICPKCKSPYWDTERTKHLNRPPAKYHGDIPKEEPVKSEPANAPSIDEELYS